MAVSNEDVGAWLQANPNATDATIATAMNQYNVSPEQVATVTGQDLGAVQGRYNAASTPLYQSLAGTSNPNQIATAYSQFARDSGGDTLTTQQAAQKYLTGIGVPQGTISQAYNQYSNPQTVAPLYSGLTPTSNQDQIAAAYNQYATAAGGNTPQTQQAAQQYLSSLNIPETGIQGAYDQYTKDYSSGIASKIFGSFGGVNPTPQGILSGFAAITKGDINADDAKRILGADTFNQYKDVFGQTAKNFVDNIMSDKTVSGKEVFDLVQQARKFGVDEKQFNEYTGYPPQLLTALKNNYDTTVKSVWNQATAGSMDPITQIKAAANLSNTMGLSNEDIAKASGRTVSEIQKYVDPVKNFNTDYKAVFSAPDVGSKDILKFVESQKSNPSVASVYGPDLTSLEQNIKQLDQKWGGSDGYQTENIYNQIKGITNAAGGKNWNGSWMSGGDNAAQEAAKMLIEKGVDNLKDLKVEKSYTKDNAATEAYNGLPVQKDESGREFVIGTGSEGFRDIQYLPPNAEKVPAKVASVDYEGNVTYAPLTAEELKTYDPKTGKFDNFKENKLVDASTGKVIGTSQDNRFTINNYSTGNFLKGNDKSFGIQMTDNGVPVPFQTAEKSGLAYSPVLPILASVLMPGIGTALSGGIAGATGAATGSLLNTALSQGIMSGGMAALTGGNIGKSALTGALTAPISAGISSVLPSGMNPSFAKFATNLGTNLTTGAITGTPVNLQNSLVGAGVNYGLQQLPLNLTPQQVNLASGIATPLLQGQKVSPNKLATTLANYAMRQKQPQQGVQ